MFEVNDSGRMSCEQLLLLSYSTGMTVMTFVCSARSLSDSCVSY